MEEIEEGPAEVEQPPVGGGELPAPYQPSPRDIRRDVIYQASGSFGQNGAPSTEALIERATAIVTFIEGSDA